MKRVRIPGFTLVELLLVVAILAILTALVLPKLDGLQSNANHGVGAASAEAGIRPSPPPPAPAPAPSP